MASLGRHEDIRGQVRTPAIALLVVGCLYALGSLGCCGNGVVNLLVKPQPIQGTSKDFQQDYEAMQKYSGPLNIASGVLGAILAGVMIYGAVQMMSLKSYGLAMTASILGLLPCSPCCLVGLPIGIWSLVVLKKPEVKAAFN